MTTNNLNKKYLKLIEDKYISEGMIADCLYSLNKRAKNCRELKNKYYGEFYHSDLFFAYRDEERAYYELKDKILRYFKPVEIHSFNQIIRRMDDRYYIDDFKDVDGRKENYMIEQKVSKDFLYYKVGERGFHKPVVLYEDYKLNKNDEYSHLKVKKFNKELKTFGIKDESKLIDVDVILELIELLNSLDYKLYLDEPISNMMTKEEFLEQVKIKWCDEYLYDDSLEIDYYFGQYDDIENWLYNLEVKKENESSNDHIINLFGLEVYEKDYAEVLLDNDRGLSNYRDNNFSLSDNRIVDVGEKFKVYIPEMTLIIKDYKVNIEELKECAEDYYNEVLYEENYGHSDLDDFIMNYLAKKSVERLNKEILVSTEERAKELENLKNEYSNVYINKEDLISDFEDVLKLKFGLKIDRIESCEEVYYRLKEYYEYK